MLHRLICIVFSALILSIPVMADDPPPWLKDAASATLPAFDKKVNAVVLHDESRVKVQEDGRITTVDTFAVRILTREGRGEAVARTVYNTDSEKVKEIRAWLIRPSGEIKSYGKNQTIDVAQVDNDVYNEARARAILAVDDADAGCVFGYEITSEKHSDFSQFVWFFQRRLPVRLSRISVELPEAWRAESITFNHDKIEPSVNGSIHTWEVRNLPFLEREPAAPEITNL